MASFFTNTFLSMNVQEFDFLIRKIYNVKWNFLMMYLECAESDSLSSTSVISMSLEAWVAL
ncbi:19544_t:CDS:2 [Funneliformis geosporum]|nr:19544_t:CDS:2 [Funneliformis geosporum]